MVSQRNSHAVQRGRVSELAERAGGDGDISRAGTPVVRQLGDAGLVVGPLAQRRLRDLYRIRRSGPCEWCNA